MTEALKQPETAEIIALANSEKALIALCQQRDQVAFKRLYDMHLGRVYSLCLRLTGQVQMAEEACQEVFIRLWQKIGSFSGQSAFSTWLYSLTSNTTISYLRKQKNWQQKFDKTEDFELSIQNITAETPTDLGPLDSLLMNLPERARIIFVLHAIEGYRHEDIANQLKITTGTSKSQFHRARGLLEQSLGQNS